MNVALSDYLIKQLRNIHKMSIILSRMIFKLSSESEVCEEQNDIKRNVIGPSTAEVWLFFY